VIPSPNIWRHPSTYELESRCFDPDGLVSEALVSVTDWAGRDVLDVGCGTGFQLPRFATSARSVVGVEPHDDLVKLARRRTKSLRSVRVMPGTAQALPLPDASVDVAHARWAYFFGPGCEPGLRELERVTRRGGTAFVVDNDGTRSTFGRWFLSGYPDVDPAAAERFWSSHGWTRIPVLTELRFESRADLEAVIDIEFDDASAARIRAELSSWDTDTWSVDYAINVFWRRF
jgi:ubiquinone/menaquinone biosynthesis C-methylase UbiE